MKRIIFQILLLLLLASACLGGSFLVRHILGLPFRALNDTLHREGAPITLDFLIPAGVHIDEKITIKEVLQIRLKKRTGTVEKLVKSISRAVPQEYLFIADTILFFFWTFLYFTFLRVFTFAGYGRALRVSLFLGGCTYYFMPDFSPGKTDDVIFFCAPLLIVAVRAYFSFRKKRNTR